MTYTLPDVNLCKAYVRVVTTTEDALFAAYLASAKAMVEACINRPIIAIPLVDTDEAKTFTAYGVVTTLQTKVWPIAVTPALVLTDGDSQVVDTTTYIVDRMRGTIKSARGWSFDNGPYQLSYTGGCSAFATWETVQGPLIGQAILDTVADFYANRTPQTYQEVENGVTVGWTNQALAPRTQKLLASVMPLAVI